MTCVGADNATVTISTPPSCVDVTLTIKLDNYPEETSWTLKNSSGTTVGSGGTYGSQPDGSTVTWSDCLSTGSYTFTINDSYGDGICCSYGVGNYDLKDASGTVLASGGSFGSSETTNFTLGTARSIPGTVQRELSIISNRVFPNPAGDYLNVELVQGEVTSAKIITTSGKTINAKFNENKVDVSDLKPGVYFLSVKNSKSDKEFKASFIKK